MGGVPAPDHQVSLENLESPNQVVSPINILDDPGVKYKSPFVGLSSIIKLLGWAEIDSNERNFIKPYDSYHISRFHDSIVTRLRCVFTTSSQCSKTQPIPLGVRIFT